MANVEQHRRRIVAHRVMLKTLIERLAVVERGPDACKENLHALNACTLAFNRLGELLDKLGK